VINGQAVSKQKFYFIYGVDRKSWWWQSQVDQEIPEAGQRLSLPNPQDPSTLPVAANRGEPEKVSSIFFGLTDRGLPEGSNILQLDLKMAVGTQPGDRTPEFNAADAKVAACFVTDFWPESDGANIWDGRPPYNKNACVVGKRGGATGAEFYTFKLDSIARPWGADPFTKNNGIVFVPVLPKDAGPNDTWQVNLQIPKRDAATTPSDDYKDTKNRVVGTIAFTVSPTAPSGPSGPTSGGGVPTSSGSSGGSVGSFAGGGGFPGSSTSTSTSTQVIPPGSSGGSGTAGGVPTPVARVPGPELPGIVWALIPLGLLALWGIRQIVLEPLGGPREEGVIAAIRRRNAAAKGIPVEDSSEEDVLTQARAAGRRARSMIRKSLRRR